MKSKYYNKINIEKNSGFSMENGGPDRLNRWPLGYEPSALTNWLRVLGMTRMRLRDEPYYVKDKKSDEDLLPNYVK